MRLFPSVKGSKKILSLVGLVCLARADEGLFDGPKPGVLLELGSSKHMDENFLGLDSQLDASLDRIASKLNNERMHRLLALNDDYGIPGLKDIIKDDKATEAAVAANAVTPKELDKLSVGNVFKAVAEKPGASASPQEPDMPRMKQVRHNAEQTQQQQQQVEELTKKVSALEAKEAQLEETMRSLALQLSQADSAQERIDNMKNEVMKEVEKKFESLQAFQQGYPPALHQGAADAMRLRQAMPSNLASLGGSSVSSPDVKRRVLEALQNTLAMIKQQRAQERGGEDSAGAGGFDEAEGTVANAFGVQRVEPEDTTPRLMQVQPGQQAQAEGGGGRDSALLEEETETFL